MQPDTLFIGQSSVYLPTCRSTNEAAHQVLLKNEATEGTLLYTDNQTAGRGQRGNTWEAVPGQNITLSFLLKPVFLSLNDQFYLTMCCSLALADLLQPYVREQIRVKWPNDIYAGNKKIAGILIENSTTGKTLQNSIIGIGININQTKFGYPTATSLKLLAGREINLASIRKELSEQLEKRYLQLRSGKKDQLKKEYLHNLLRYQEWHPYKVGNQEITGMIVGVNETGKLALQAGDKLL
ncbi:MAG: biotin--[acetyl-CoA-carboxylase] ligase, partial [Chitinophagaceae bacterium]